MKRRQGYLYCVEVFLAVRIGLVLLGFVAVAALPSRGLVSVPGWPDQAYTPGVHNLVTPFEKQDALWFLRIATDGYRPDDVSAAFFPLYPVAVRVVTPLVGGHPLAAGLLVSNLAFLGALLVLYSLTAREFGETLARRTVLYRSVFPTALFFFAPYSESLFLLLAVTSFWGARRSKWWTAGLAGAGAALTRSVGLVLVPALLVEAVHQAREGKKGLPGRLAWSLAPALGTLSYLAYWQSRDNWRAPFDIQSNWGRHLGLPWVTLAEATTDAFANGSYWMLDWLVVVPVLVAAAYGLFKLRPSYSVYAWVSVVTPLCLMFDDRPLMSLPRFVAVVFPAFWAAAFLAERRRVAHDLIVAASAAALALLAAMFVNSWFIF